MAINPTGISWLDQWILSQGGKLRGDTADTPDATAASAPPQYYPKRWVDRYLTDENWDYNDDSSVSGPSPSISVGESFESLFDSAKGIFDNFEVGDVFDVGEGAKGLFSGGLGGLVDGIKADFSNFLAAEFDPINTYTRGNQGPFSNMVRALQDPSVGMGRKVGASMLGVGSTLLGGLLGGPFGLFGGAASALNSMGAYHDWNPNEDSNLAYNPATSKFEWDSEAPGGGGIQWGPKSARNMAKDITENHPDEWVTIQNEEGAPLGQIQGKDLADWVDMTTGVLGPDGRMSMSAYEDPFALGYMTDMFGPGPSMSMDFPGMTNSEALGSLSNKEGYAWNSLAANNPTLGYNDLVDLAAREQAQLEESMALSGDWASGPYGGTIGGLSLDDAFANAMEEAGPTGTVDSGSDGSSNGSSNNDGDGWGSFSPF